MLGKWKPQGKDHLMRVVFTSWLLFVVAGLAYMLAIAVSGR